MTECDRELICGSTKDLSLVSLGCSGSSLSSEPTSPPGCNKTNLLARRSIAPNSASMTNVLVVTSSMRMLHWVHGHTTHLRPAVLPLRTGCMTPLGSSSSAGESSMDNTSNTTITTKYQPHCQTQAQTSKKKPTNNLKQQEKKQRLRTQLKHFQSCFPLL